MSLIRIKGPRFRAVIKLLIYVFISCTSYLPETKSGGFQISGLSQFILYLCKSLILRHVSIWGDQTSSLHVDFFLVQFDGSKKMKPGLHTYSISVPGSIRDSWSKSNLHFPFILFLQITVILNILKSSFWGNARHPVKVLLNINRVQGVRWFED